MALEVANMIRAQLGGGRFCAMTGASNFTGSENSLSFKLPRGVHANGDRKKPVTHVRITLDRGRDVYLVEFMNCRLTRTQLKQEVVESIDGVYNDDLQRIFTSVTGLDTHL